jgi:hypothetical protein
MDLVWLFLKFILNQKILNLTKHFEYLIINFIGLKLVLIFIS